MTPPEAGRFVPFADRRLPIVDVLRGFALLGIILVNVATFAFSMDAVISGTIPLISSLDRALFVAVDLFVTGKFFPLFALLFGFGLTIQIDRAALRQDDARIRLVRRQLTLVVLGVLHAYFIWPGDILAFYGCLGLFLLLFVRTRPKRLTTMAVLVLVVPTMAWCVLLGAVAFVSAKFPEVEGLLNEVPNAPMGPYELRQALGANAAGMRDLMLSSAISTPVSLAMALFGMALARSRWLHERVAHAEDWRRLRLWCLAPALLANGALGCLALGIMSLAPGYLVIVRFLGICIGGPALSAIYLCTFALRLGEGSWPWLERAGRMSLSNYLFQSMACASIFFGFGLKGHTSFGGCVVIAVGVWCVQIPLSVLWLKRFKFGPVEWLLRSVTYARFL